MSEAKYVGSKSLSAFLNNLKNIFATKSPVKGATSSSNGASGLVPAPAAGKQTSFLRGDGTWAEFSNGITYSDSEPTDLSNATWIGN